MFQIKLSLVLASTVALLAVIIATPALAADCVTRPLDQGSGNVKICTR